MDNEIKDITNSYLLDVFNYETLSETSILWNVLEKKATAETTYINEMNYEKSEILACFFVMHNESIKETGSTSESISIGHVSIAGSNEVNSNLLALANETLANYGRNSNTITFETFNV